jgi:hypothetical protein
MNRRLVWIGVILVVIGAAALGVGAYEVRAAATVTSIYSAYGSGEWVSDEINVSAASTITLAHPPSSMGVVTAADLPSVTAGNLNSTGIAPTSSAAGSAVYSVPSGSYYVVYFGATDPGTKITYVATASGELWGGITLLGIALLIAGGIVAIVGVLKKPKQPKAAPTGLIQEYPGQV